MGAIGAAGYDCSCTGDGDGLPVNYVCNASEANQPAMSARFSEVSSALSRECGGSRIAPLRWDVPRCSAPRCISCGTSRIRRGDRGGGGAGSDRGGGGGGSGGGDGGDGDCSSGGGARGNAGKSSRCSASTPCDDAPLPCGSGCSSGGDAYDGMHPVPTVVESLRYLPASYDQVDTFDLERSTHRYQRTIRLMQRNYNQLRWTREPTDAWLRSGVSVLLVSMDKDKAGIGRGSLPAMLFLVHDLAQVAIVPTDEAWSPALRISTSNIEVISKLLPTDPLAAVLEEGTPAVVASLFAPR
eukprot:NODE_9959_length_1387_cov_3.644444.p1 GENE.NODE_9959_length_1387_cov_3.644444~~NODE_9959_length_1387_cov_3.644444.p1  ORF type:complete len:298 (+),score=47.94 NODE_9959_length_1387_cov_3.644444:190-1083(+)